MVGQEALSEGTGIVLSAGPVTGRLGTGTMGSHIEWGERRNEGSLVEMSVGAHGSKGR